MAGKVATDFEKIIHADRDRRKNEALAARIFNKNKDRDRRASAPFKSGSGAGSIASRVGVKRVVSSNIRHSLPGNINGEWTHDLHRPAAGARMNTSSLASRISTTPTAPNLTIKRQQRRAAQVASALNRTVTAPAAASAVPGRGITIRGLAGPFVVMAQNFAPGTTAADIESAMTPVGGLVQSCRLLKTQPIVIAEIVFESKEGADRVIDTFNNQTADSRVLHVYPKIGGTVSVTPAASAAAAAASRSRLRGAVQDSVVDGSLGFNDPMDMDGDVMSSSSSRQRSGLYSDQLVDSDRRGGRNWR